MFEKLKKIFVKEEIDYSKLTKKEIRALNKKNPRGNACMGRKYKKPTPKLTKKMQTTLKNPNKKSL